MEKLTAFWEDLKFKLGIGLDKIENNSCFKGFYSNSSKTIDEIVNKTQNIKRLNDEQKSIYKSYIHYKYFGCNKRSVTEPLLEVRESWIKVLEILEDKKQHNFDIELSEESIQSYANENKIDYDLALEILIIDVVCDREETNFSTLEFMAKEHQIDCFNKPSPISLLNKDERKLYSRFLNTNIKKNN